MEEIKKVLQVIRKNGLYPDVKTLEGVSSQPVVIANGKKVINFASANYLGLANDERIKKAVIEGIKKYGLHPTGARLVSGTLDIHRELERETAKFKHGQDAIIFQTGTLANIGTIPAIMDLPVVSISSAISNTFKLQKGEIFSDELNHASIIDGCRLAKANTTVFKHCDMTDLEKKLKKSRAKRKLIVTDGVFSMEGDIAPLPEIVKLAKKYNALTMVDDAHSTGVLGENGEGTLEYFGLNEGIDIYMGTYSKAFGLVGGFIVGSQELIDYLRITARTYIFSGATFGSLAAGNLKALEIIRNEKDRRHKLWENSEYLRKELNKVGFDTLSSKGTPIVPILIGDDERAIKVANDLFEEGFFSPCVRWPAVAKNRSIIRVTLTSLHEREQIDNYIKAITKLGRKYKVIN